MQMLSNSLLNKIKRRFYYNATDIINYDLLFLSLAQAFYKILTAQKKKSKLITAFTDTNLYRYTEALSDIGFICNDPLRSFFGGKQNDSLHPYNPLENLKKNEYDVVLGVHGIDLIFFTNKVLQALNEIKLCNFQTCLNFNKISILAALFFLIQNNSTILEIGSYQCGTTIFLGKLCTVFNKNIKIFACDTFEGIPQASESDKSDLIFYDSGFFNDNPIKKVQKRINRQKVNRYINLVKGDVTSTLQQLFIENVSLVFLDTDQYKGTKAGLDFIIRLKLQPHIIIDDSGFSGVNLAINEFLKIFPTYNRSKFLNNFDYLVPQKNHF